MSSNISSSDLRAKALIDTLKKPQQITDNYIVKYICTQPPKTELGILEVVRKFSTSDNYQTSILEKAFPTRIIATPSAPIEDQLEVNKYPYSVHQAEGTGERNCFCLCLGFIFGRPYHG